MQLHQTQGTQTQRCLRRYRQQRSQRALHAGMEMFSWGKKGAELGVKEWRPKDKERFMPHIKKLSGFCVFIDSWINLKKLFVMLTLNLYPWIWALININLKLWASVGTLGESKLVEVKVANLEFRKLNRESDLICITKALLCFMSVLIVCLPSPTCSGLNLCVC